MQWRFFGFFFRPYSARVSQPCIVKLGTPIHVLNGRTDISQSARRLEVLKQCVGYIFSDKIAEAKKVCLFNYFKPKNKSDYFNRQVVQYFIQLKVMKMLELHYVRN